MIPELRFIEQEGRILVFQIKHALHESLTMFFLNS